MLRLVVESREVGNNVCAIENNRPISGRQGRLIHIDVFCFVLRELHLYCIVISKGL